MSSDSKEDQTSLERQIREQEIIYQEELKKNSTFSTRKAIREKIRLLRELLREASKPG